VPGQVRQANGNSDCPPFLDTAADALDGLVLDGSDSDGDVLLARGNLAMFQGDLDTATSLSEIADITIPIARGRGDVRGDRERMRSG